MADEVIGLALHAVVSPVLGRPSSLAAVAMQPH